MRVEDSRGHVWYGLDGIGSDSGEICFALYTQSHQNLALSQLNTSSKCTPIRLFGLSNFTLFDSENMYQSLQQSYKASLQDKSRVGFLRDSEWT